MFKEHYRTKAREASNGVGFRMPEPPNDIVTLAADAAVNADRKRMGEQLRNRIMNNPPVELKDLPPEVSMIVEATMLDLCTQIENGMPWTEADDVT